MVVEALNPSCETQKREDLGLDLQGNVEVFNDVVDTQWNAGPGPQHHHRRLKTGGIMAAIVDDNLWDELRNGRPSGKGSEI